jgi:MFS family permease
LWLTVALTMVGSLGMCLTWPALEALVSEGEPPARLQGLIGAYNVVWAVTAGFAYFTGGALQLKWGWTISLCYVPAGLLILELALAAWLRRKVRQQPAVTGQAPLPLLHPMRESYRSPIAPATFLKLALVANPMAYLAINTVISSAPALAQRLNFSPMLAGFVCSIWLFARAGAFVALWLWPGWHYRFRFLAAAYVALMLSFGVMLLAPHLCVLVLAQLFFGPAVGLIYYSSLFYSMRFFPAHAGSGAWAVCLLLTPGLIFLYWLRYREPTPPPPL